MAENTDASRNSLLIFRATTRNDARGHAGAGQLRSAAPQAVGRAWRRGGNGSQPRRKSSDVADRSHRRRPRRAADSGGRPSTGRTVGSTINRIKTRREILCMLSEIGEGPPRCQSRRTAAEQPDIAEKMPDWCWSGFPGASGRRAQSRLRTSPRGFQVQPGPVAPKTGRRGRRLSLPERWCPSARRPSSR